MACNACGTSRLSFVPFDNSRASSEVSKERSSFIRGANNSCHLRIVSLTSFLDFSPLFSDPHSLSTSSSLSSSDSCLTQVSTTSSMALTDL